MLLAAAARSSIRRHDTHQAADCSGAHAFKSPARHP